jgi:tRNA G18 (ribose-2'-O)-methylase SpoU
MAILLFAPDDFKNLCVIARSLDCFGIHDCSLFDPHHLVRARYGRSYSRMARTVSAGAFSLIRWNIIENPESFLRDYPGRRIATLPDSNADSVFCFPFQDSDLIIFGSEREGIPPETVNLCQTSITIPMKGTTRSLNLSVAVSIVLAEMIGHRMGSNEKGTC